MRNRIRTSKRSVFHHDHLDRHRVHRHHHHLFADQHARSMAELEVIAGHHRDT